MLNELNAYPFCLRKALRYILSANSHSPKRENNISGALIAHGFRPVLRLPYPLGLTSALSTRL